MILCVSGANKTVEALLPHAHLGRIADPLTRTAVPRIVNSGCPWFAGNGCYKGFHEKKYRNMLDKIKDQQSRCLFVAAPDHPADARATLTLFDTWQPILQSYNLPVGFVLQDGMECEDVPWDRLDALILCGTNEFRFSNYARYQIGVANSKKKWVHMSRVNSESRIRAAHHRGVNSIDGTGFSRYSNTLIPWGLELLTKLEFNYGT